MLTAIRNDILYGVNPLPRTSGFLIQRTDAPAEVWECGPFMQARFHRNRRKRAVAVALMLMKAPPPQSKVRAAIRGDKRSMRFFARVIVQASNRIPERQVPKWQGMR